MVLPVCQAVCTSKEAKDVVVALMPLYAVDLLLSSYSVSLGSLFHILSQPICC